MNVHENKRIADEDEIILSELIKQINSERVLNETLDVVDIQSPTIKEEPTLEINDQDPETGTDKVLPKNRRADETDEKRKVQQQRREISRRYYLQRRMNETVEQRERRLTRDREYNKQRKYVNQIPERHERRLQAQRKHYERMKLRNGFIKKVKEVPLIDQYLEILQNETVVKPNDPQPVQCEKRNETPEDRERRLSKRRECYRKRKERFAKLTPEERDRILIRKNVKRALRKINMLSDLKKVTEEKRLLRLQKRREYYQRTGKSKYLIKRANETAEQREHRLSVRRAWIRKSSENGSESKITRGHDLGHLSDKTHKLLYK